MSQVSHLSMLRCKSVFADANYQTLCITPHGLFHLDCKDWENCVWHLEPCPSSSSGQTCLGPPAKESWLHGFHEHKRASLYLMPFEPKKDTGLDWIVGKLWYVSVHYLKIVLPKHGITESKDMKMLKGFWYIFSRIHEFLCPWTWYANNCFVTPLPPLGITILGYSVELTRERGKKSKSPSPSIAIIWTCPLKISTTAMWRLR